MANTYKGYSISQSLNGNKIIYIARNRSEVVIFRESSENKLKSAIDNHLENLEKALAQAKKDKLAKVEKAKERDLFQDKEDYKKEVEEAGEVIEELAEESEKTEDIDAPQTRVVRGPGGRFVSKKSQEDQDDDPKKGFWDRFK